MGWKKSGGGQWFYKSIIPINLSHKALVTHVVIKNAYQKNLSSLFYRMYSFKIFLVFFQCSHGKKEIMIFFYSFPYAR